MERDEIQPIKPAVFRNILFAVVEGLLYQVYLAENRRGAEALRRLVAPFFRHA